MKTNWNDLPEHVKNDLIAWYNLRPEDLCPSDKNKLTALYDKGLFHAWDCPQCGERVYEGEPEQWDGFQGVCQVDYTSYPGDSDVFQPEYIKRLCDACRSRGHNAHHQETREAY